MRDFTLERCSGFSQVLEESGHSRRRIRRVQAQAVQSDQGEHLRVGGDGQGGGWQSGRDQITNSPGGREDVQTTPRVPSGHTGH